MTNTNDGTNVLIVDAVCLCGKSLAGIEYSLEIIESFIELADLASIQFNGLYAGVDTTDKSERLRQKDSTYKANRPQDGTTEWEKRNGEAKLIKALGKANFSIIKPLDKLDAFRYEADDMIASLATQLTTFNKTVTAYILTRDKDLAIIQSDACQVFYHTKDGFVDAVTYVESHFGIPTSQLAHYLAIVGDSADNWGGIKGIGHVKYHKRMKESAEFPEVTKKFIEDAMSLVSPKSTIPIDIGTSL